MVRIAPEFAWRTRGSLICSIGLLPAACIRPPGSAVRDESPVGRCLVWCSQASVEASFRSASEPNP